MHQQKVELKDKLNIVAKRRPKAMQLGYTDTQIDPKRKVLYRNFHDVNGTIFLVEISRNSKKIFIILFENYERPDKFIHEILTEKQASKLMKECNNLFENLVKRFYVKFGKLQIDGFSGKGGYALYHSTIQDKILFN